MSLKYNLRARSLFIRVWIAFTFLTGCAARTAQQVIDIQRDHAIALQHGAEITRLERLRRNSKCLSARAAFEKIDVKQVKDPRVQAMVDYTKHTYSLQRYIVEKQTTAENALVVLGDLVVPPVLPKELDPFNGCVVLPGAPLEQPYKLPSGKASDNFIFYWQSRDWREDMQFALATFNKFLPAAERTTFDMFLLDYSLTLGNALQERLLDNGEITLLQYLRGGNAGIEYLRGQTLQYAEQLRGNLRRAKERDDQMLNTAAVALGGIATAALALAVVDSNYRIANAQSAAAVALRLQGLQAPTPIRCSYTVPGRYGTAGHITCQ